MTIIRPVTDKTFDNEVLSSDSPVIVDFWAEWCGPCRSLHQVLEEFAKEHAEKVTVVTVNVDENPTISARYGVISIPALYGFQKGTPVITVHGAKPKPALEDVFSKLIYG